MTYNLISITNSRDQERSSSETALMMARHDVDTRPALDPEKVALGRRIREARMGADMSQHDLALRLGITAGAVGQWELGITAPKGQTLQALPALLGVSHEWLAGTAGRSRSLVAATSEEETVLRHLRKMTKDEQRMLIRQLRGLVETD